MNLEAIFSDESKLYRNPECPRKGGAVKIKLRLAHGDVARCFLVHGKELVKMSLFEQAEVFDYYVCEIRVTEELYSYHFKIQEDEQEFFYDRFGVSEEERDWYEFKIAPGFDVPEWSKGAVMYQIMTDRFYNGDITNDVVDHEYYYVQTYAKRIMDWNQLPGTEFAVAEFYGGDLEGVRQKLSYLRSLGVEVVYFNPLFVSPSNHKYDISDYDNIDPHLGKIVYDFGDVLKEGNTSNADSTRFKRRITNKMNLEASNKFFAEFVEEAHKKGFKIILDGVFNHCGSFNKWLDKEGLYDKSEGYEPGAYVSAKSPYRDFFGFADKDEESWPDNNSYEGWWGFDTLPKLNYEGSKELYDYILEVGKKWVSPPYNVDGWRLDVAADLGHGEEFNHKFWRDFRNAVKKANPNAVILAEHYGDASGWLKGDQWDTVMNYDAFMDPVSYFFTGMEKHSDSYEPWAVGDGKRFEGAMKEWMSKMMNPSLQCAMNQLSNHDHSRFLTRTNHKVGRVMELGHAAAGEDVDTTIFALATLMQMTWPGAPTLYYGDEVGQVGFTDPDNRRTYPWGHINTELIDYCREAIMLHKFSPALRSGSFMFLDSGENFVSYARFDDREKMVMIFNLAKEGKGLDIPVWKADIPMSCEMTQVFGVSRKTYSIMPKIHEVHDGILHIEVPQESAFVLRYNL